MSENKDGVDLSEVEGYDPTFVGGEEFVEEELDSEDRGDNPDTPEPEPETAEAETDDVQETSEEETAEAEAEVEDAEPEPEPESEDAVETEAELEEEPEPEPEKEHRIPKSRFNEVNEQKKAAQLRVRELEAKLAEQELKPAEEAFDFDAKETEYMELVLDGELEKARIIRTEIRTAERQQVQELAANVKTEAVTATQAQQEYMGVVNELQDNFGEFDPNGKDFAQDLVDEVMDMHEAFMSRPNNIMSSAQSLQKAAKYVANMHDLTDKSIPVEKVKEPEPEVDLKKSVKGKPTNVKEKVKQANSQPPNMDAGEIDNKGTPNIEEMGEDEYDALPESTKRRLRGDIIG